MAPEINSYIEKRYCHWLDYAQFHCTLQGFRDLKYDLLDTVLLNILEKDGAKLEKLYKCKKLGYTELDFYILAAIKLNAHSKTSPFRWTFFERLPYDKSLDPWLSYQCLCIRSEDYNDETDRRHYQLLSDLQLLRLACEKADLSPGERLTTHCVILGGMRLTDVAKKERKKITTLYRENATGREKIIKTFNKLKYHEN